MSFKLRDIISNNIIDNIYSSDLYIYLSIRRSDIYKMIVHMNEVSNSDLLSTSPRTLGIIARLNRWHSWNMPYTSNGGQKQALTSENLPKLGQNGCDPVQLLPNKV